MNFLIKQSTETGELIMRQKAWKRQKSKLQKWRCDMKRRIEKISSLFEELYLFYNSTFLLRPTSKGIQILFV